MELKKAAKQGNRDVCLVFAKEIVNSRKGVFTIWIAVYLQPSKYLVHFTITTTSWPKDISSAHFQSANQLGNDEHESPALDA